MLFACLKRNLTDEIRVAQLAGYVSEQTAYHHGEASLHTTIIGMAQVSFHRPAGAGLEKLNKGRSTNGDASPQGERTPLVEF